MAFTLPRLPMGGFTGTTPEQQQIWWQEVVDKIEGQEQTQDTLIQQIIAAQNAANAIMPDVPDVTITADYTGAVSPADQLPKNIRFYRHDGTDDVSDEATWSVSASAGLTATIGLTGVVSLTAITQSGTITATSVHNDISRSRTINITKAVGGAPEGAGGGSSASDSSFATISSIVAAAISDELSVVAGANGEIELTAPLSVGTGEVSPAGTYEVFGQWYETTSGVPVALGSEVASDPDTEVVDDGSGNYFHVPGSLSVSHPLTALTPGNTYKFVLYARNSSGTRTMFFSGTASGVGS